MSTNEKGTPQSRTYTVNDIAAILGIGRASAYKLANFLFVPKSAGIRVQNGRRNSLWRLYCVGAV